MRRHRQIENPVAHHARHRVNTLCTTGLHRRLFDQFVGIGIGGQGANTTHQRRRCIRRQQTDLIPIIFL